MFDYDDRPLGEPAFQLLQMLNDKEEPTATWVGRNVPDGDLTGLWDGCHYPHTLLFLLAPFLDAPLVCVTCAAFIRLVQDLLPADERCSTAHATLEAFASGRLELHEALCYAVHKDAWSAHDHCGSAATDALGFATNAILAESSGDDRDYIVISMVSSAWSVAKARMKGVPWGQTADGSEKKAYRDACEQLAAIIRETIPRPSFADLLTAHRRAAPLIPSP
jgi:hypothetical protein